MPLVIFCGVPSSGKTTRANELKTYFENNDRVVHLVSEHDAIKQIGLDKNVVYKNAHKEKQIRGWLKSEVIRLIGPKNVVILDGSNYIKGYRYELYCATKANKCTQCTVECGATAEQSWEFNENRPEDERYSREIFDALHQRYEEPNSNNRWDSPLFVVFPKDEMDCKAISDSVIGTKPPPPNKSTQNPPLSSTNFLYDLDKITQEINKLLISLKISDETEEVQLPNYPDVTINLKKANAPELQRLRRQFISYSKTHTPELNKIGNLYVRYLKSNLPSY